MIRSNNSALKHSRLDNRHCRQVLCKTSLPLHYYPPPPLLARNALLPPPLTIVITSPQSIVDLSPYHCWCSQNSFSPSHSCFDIVSSDLELSADIALPLIAPARGWSRLRSWPHCAQLDLPAAQYAWDCSSQRVRKYRIVTWYGRTVQLQCKMDSQQ